MAVLGFNIFVYKLIHDQNLECAQLTSKGITRWDILILEKETPLLIHGMDLSVCGYELFINNVLKGTLRCSKNVLNTT